MPAHSAVPPRFWRAPGFPGFPPGIPWPHEGSLKGHRRTVREAFSTCGPLGLASWLPSKLVNRSDGPSLRSNMFPAHDELVCGGTRGDEGRRGGTSKSKLDPVVPCPACLLPLCLLLTSSNYPAAEMVAMAYVGMYGWNRYEWFGDTAIIVQACCSRSSRSDTGEWGKYRAYTICVCDLYVQTAHKTPRL